MKTFELQVNIQCWSFRTLRQNCHSANIIPLFCYRRFIQRIHGSLRHLTIVPGIDAAATRWSTKSKSTRWNLWTVDPPPIALRAAAAADKAAYSST